MLKLASFVALTVVCVHAQDVSEQFYSTIRSGDAAALKQLVKSSDVNTKDKRETTPLMYAAAVGNAEAMRILLDAGADAKAKNALGATALHWCAGDFEKVRMLVEKGADVNAVAKSGRSPLALAAVHFGNARTLTYLIEHGAKVNAMGPPEVLPLAVAVQTKDASMVQVLLEKGADVHADGDAALVLAAGLNFPAAVEMLLAKGANVNAVTPPESGPPVKNGKIALGSFTALILASAYGPPELVKTLLDAGAKVNVQDVRGMTPLMYSVSSDRSDPRIVKMLLDKGADVSVTMKSGDTAVDWAKKNNDPRILSLFGLKKQTYAPLVAASAEKTGSAREAAAKGIALLQKTSGGFFKEGGCVSCHAQAITSMAIRAAKENHIAVDEATVSAELKSARLQYSSFEQRFLQKLGGGGDPDSSEYTLFLFDAFDAPADRTTDAMVVNILSSQVADGSWRGFGISRPPMEDFDFSRTAMGIRAINRYAIPARKAEIDAATQRGVAWLNEHDANANEERVMQILGQLWAGKPASAVQKQAKALASLQRADGGWAQNANLGSDAYATGQALNTLRQTGMKVSDAAYQRGVAFLLKTQKPDGSWYVASRSPKFQPYFQSGFPHDHDQWISMAATGWAAIALAHGSSVDKPLQASR